MANGDMETLKAGAAPDLKKIEEKIQLEVESEFPFLTPEERRAIICSRLKILSNPDRPRLIKADLGEGASKKIKENLFE